MEPMWRHWMEWYVEGIQLTNGDVILITALTITGSTVCCGENNCQKLNDWYFQCLPGRYRINFYFDYAPNNLFLHPNLCHDAAHRLQILERPHHHHLNLEPHQYHHRLFSHPPTQELHHHPCKLRLIHLVLPSNTFLFLINVHFYPLFPSPSGLSRPFPQHVQYQQGSILPNHLSRDQLDNDVRSFYDKWKNRLAQMMPRKPPSLMID